MQGVFYVHKEGDEVHVSETEASGGSKEGVVRWVLAGGLLLAVLLMSIVWIIPAMTQGDVEEEATVSGEIRSMEEEGDGTDSIVGVPSDTDLGDDEVPALEDQTETENGIDVIEN
ncbi:hypothetical protein [Qipengyuania sphaerica]|uniref:hypothetical protein n=1 Tax=Qipengyuania sphaerica TaxID=2867243 RepID=UPI001C86B04B|nr:hypothetical protein [Qipengyuania sphaerica]MBX7539600.1 hypothetical protein [Qipengyuania sphaerica]